MKRLIHIQVPANMPTSQQQKVGEQVSALIHNPQQDSIFLTPADVAIHNIPIDDETAIAGVYVYPLFGLDDIARIVVNTNADYSRSLGEDVQYWDETGPEVRASIVRGILSALRYNPTPEQNHQNFLDDRTKEGWTYGPEKNVELKQHPDLLPFEHLPAEQKAKNHIFLSLVSSLKSKLPAVAQPTQYVWISSNDDKGREPQIFTELSKGDVFMFVEDTEKKVWRAISDVYVNYLSVPPVHTIDVEAYVPQNTGDVVIENQPEAAPVEGQ
jgi:hypothetical protein